MRNALLALMATLLIQLDAAVSGPVTIRKAEFDGEFLLQANYRQAGSREDFSTSRSRIVTFERIGHTLRMVETHRGMGQPDRVLADVPIRGETDRTLAVDFNAGFDRVFRQEDRTGEDYNGRSENEDYSFIPLTERRLLNVSRDGPMLVLEQHALDEDGGRIVVHHYLSPYRHNDEFEPFELENLDDFGFYETYPRRVSGRIVLYAMKFASHKPIVFALSADIPAAYHEAVRDGVRYWNRALGTPLLRVIGVSRRQATSTTSSSGSLKAIARRRRTSRATRSPARFCTRASSSARR